MEDSVAWRMCVESCFRIIVNNIYVDLDVLRMWLYNIWTKLRCRAFSNLHFFYSVVHVFTHRHIKTLKAKYTFTVKSNVLHSRKLLCHLLMEILVSPPWLHAAEHLRYLIIWSLISCNIFEATVTETSFLQHCADVYIYVFLVWKDVELLRLGNLKYLQRDICTNRSSVHCAMTSRLYLLLCVDSLKQLNILA